MMPHNRNSGSLLLLGTGFMGAALGGWLTYSAVGINHAVPLPRAIDADQEYLERPGAPRLSYYADRSGAGRPLVLVHSINAAASSYEMRPIFEMYRGQRPIYALDLPGFGFSERSNRVYSPELYVQAIVDLLSQVVGEAADVVALSLGCEFAARAALEHPEHFNSLILISPSGFTDRSNKMASQRASENETSDKAYKALSFSLWSQAFYDLLVTTPSIRYFLQKSFEGDVDRGLLDYGYATAHQPGARLAPLYFVSGKLFSPRICQEVYELLTLPVLVLYDRDAFVRFDTLPDLVANHANWHAVRIASTNGLPQFEKLAETTRAMDGFWSDLAPDQSDS